MDITEAYQVGGTAVKAAFEGVRQADSQTAERETGDSAPPLLHPHSGT